MRLPDDRGVERVGIRFGPYVSWSSSRAGLLGGLDFRGAGGMWLAGYCNARSDGPVTRRSDCAAGRWQRWKMTEPPKAQRLCAPGPRKLSQALVRAGVRGVGWGTKTRPALCAG